MDHNSKWTQIEHGLKIDRARIEHKFSDLAVIEQQLNTDWPQIL